MSTIILVQYMENHLQLDMFFCFHRVNYMDALFPLWIKVHLLMEPFVHLNLSFYSTGLLFVIIYLLKKV